MNDHDKDNLNFLLTASPEVLKDWYESVDEDDHAYAQELMAAYAEELNELQKAKQIENTLDGFEDQLAKMNSFPLVESLMSKLIH
jgi:hypothetical protein